MKKKSRMYFITGVISFVILIICIVIYKQFTDTKASKKLETSLVNSIKNDSSNKFTVNVGHTEVLSKDFLNKIEDEKKILIINGKGLRYEINTSDLKGKEKGNMSIMTKKLSEAENKKISTLISKNSEKEYEIYGFVIGDEKLEVGYKMQATIVVDSKWCGELVNVYRYDEESNQYSFVDRIKVEEDGNATLNIFRYGKYFLTSQDAPRYDESNVKLIYNEEFNEDGLPNKERWKYDLGGSGWGNEEKQNYTDSKENAKVQDGKLIITAKKERYEFNDYTSARLLSKDSWLYGRFEIKAKLPKGVGTWPAIWMMPKDSEYGSWPQSGEMDIMEHVGFDHGTVHATIHSQKYYWKANTQKAAQIQVDNVDSEFHVYSMEWTPHKIDFFVDGKKYFTTELDLIKDKEDGWKAWPYDKPFYLILNIAVGGSWGGQKGIDDSIFPQTMEVDYVKVYDLGVEKETMN
ncbi:glycoside hydrolase family 16 protein [Clostridium cellulovorans]|uniref:Licheninase n=2 Tax=Clostridium cellulovorans TaxID=1493 RepID=D9SRI4_CLOC7|nr:glycoside hydrolase family 16 protein [Clostridium cellulovorans]ADL52413.1 Licheninase [Clostridium cellulovorans 743B]BAV13066.1 laminarinase [Clostridium cellulovorans]